MRSVFLGFTLALGALTAACTIDPPAGTPTPPMAGVLEPGPREATFGRTGDEVINNPQLRDRIRNLFGADWTPVAEGRGKIAKGAAAYFGRTEPPRGVRVGDANYVAVSGCVLATCRNERVLLLIQEGGEGLLARAAGARPHGGPVPADLRRTRPLTGSRSTDMLRPACLVPSSSLVTCAMSILSARVVSAVLATLRRPERGA